MNSIHDYTLHPEPPLGRARAVTVRFFFCISLFFLEIFFATVEFYMQYQGCRGGLFSSAMMI